MTTPFFGSGKLGKVFQKTAKKDPNTFLPPDSESTKKTATLNIELMASLYVLSSKVLF